VENFLTDPPATDWGRAVAKASFLLILFAQTPEAVDLGRAKLIADVFADFKRLLAEPKRPPVAGDAGVASTCLIQKRIAMANDQHAETATPRSRKGKSSRSRRPTRRRSGSPP
jgi:hypothetical protein